MSDLLSNSAVQIVLVVVVVLLVGYLVMNYMKSPAKHESFTNKMPATNKKPATVAHFDNVSRAAVAAAPKKKENFTGEYEVSAGEAIDMAEQPKPLGAMEATQMSQLPAECYPKDILSSADLLPRDADSAWAQVAPSGQGSLQDKNFLSAGFHVGINTVGQTLRNANYQLRSEPPNPQVKVSPWNQTTIDPDTNRRPMEIGGCS